jgi:hypothetical protein
MCAIVAQKSAIFLGHNDALTALGEAIGLELAL